MTVSTHAADHSRRRPLPSRDEFEAAMARLGPEARSAMLDDLVDALWVIQDSDEVEPALSVLRAWYVDTQVVSRPGFAERLAEAQGQVVTQEELLGRVGGGA